MNTFLLEFLYVCSVNNLVVYTPIQTNPRGQIYRGQLCREYQFVNEKPKTFAGSATDLRRSKLHPRGNSSISPGRIPLSEPSSFNSYDYDFGRKHGGGQTRKNESRTLLCLIPRVLRGIHNQWDFVNVSGDLAINSYPSSHPLRAEKYIYIHALSVDGISRLVIQNPHRRVSARLPCDSRNTVAQYARAFAHTRTPPKTVFTP